MGVQAKWLLEEVETKIIGGRGIRKGLSALSNYETCVASSEVSISILKMAGRENEAEELKNYLEEVKRRVGFICDKANNLKKIEIRQLIRTQVQQFEKEIYEKGVNANDLLKISCLRSCGSGVV